MPNFQRGAYLWRKCPMKQFDKRDMVTMFIEYTAKGITQYNKNISPRELVNVFVDYFHSRGIVCITTSCSWSIVSQHGPFLINTQSLFDHPVDSRSMYIASVLQICENFHILRELGKRMEYNESLDKFAISEVPICEVALLNFLLKCDFVEESVVAISFSSMIVLDEGEIVEVRGLELPTRIPHVFEYNENREYSVIISRLKTNHGNFPAHLAKIGLIESPICDEDQEYADLNHLFFMCTKNKNAIEVFMDKLKNIGYQYPLNINTLLASGRKDALEPIEVPEVYEGRFWKELRLYLRYNELLNQKYWKKKMFFRQEASQTPVFLGKYIDLQTFVFLKSTKACSRLNHVEEIRTMIIMECSRGQRIALMAINKQNESVPETINVEGDTSVLQTIDTNSMNCSEPSTEDEYLYQNAPIVLTTKNHQQVSQNPIDMPLFDIRLFRWYLLLKIMR
nr:unnamed protein product [Callosobruchus chinensis]